jgi:hypothetical protein
MQHPKADAKLRSEPGPVVQPRLCLRGAELPGHAGRLINMLCDDPTDPDLLEVEWFIESARGKY